MQIKFYLQNLTQISYNYFQAILHYITILFNVEKLRFNYFVQILNLFFYRIKKNLYNLVFLSVLAKLKKVSIYKTKRTELLFLVFGKAEIDSLKLLLLIIKAVFFYLELNKF